MMDKNNYLICVGNYIFITFRRNIGYC